MSYTRMLLAFTLAIVMLTGCKEPIGPLNRDVHIASTCTTYCVVDTVAQNTTGRVEMDMDGVIRYAIYNGVIRRAYEVA